MEFKAKSHVDLSDGSIVGPPGGNAGRVKQRRCTIKECLRGKAARGKTEPDRLSATARHLVLAWCMVQLGRLCCMIDVSIVGAAWMPSLAGPSVSLLWSQLTDYTV